MSPLADNHNSDASSALKIGTDDLHRHVEESIDWRANLEDLGAYEQFLAKICYFLPPADRLIEQHLGGAENWFQTRRTAAWAEADLRELVAGHPDSTQVASRNEETSANDLYQWVEGAADAAGILYVLEGSTMGSLFLCNLACTNFDSPVDAPVKYLSAYGKETARRWQDTKLWLDRFLSTENEIATAISAARMMFQIYGGQLSCRT